MFGFKDKLQGVTKKAEFKMGEVRNILNTPSFSKEEWTQDLVKGVILCFRNLYFCFWHGENTSTASQLSKEINKVPHLLQNLDYFNYFRTFGVDAKFLYNVTLSDFVALSELVKFRLKLEHFFLEITVNFLKMWIAIYSVLKKEGIKHGGII